MDDVRRGVRRGLRPLRASDTMSAMTRGDRSMAEQCILITGGAGFIGSHLADRLLEQPGVRVVIVDDFNDFYDPALKRSNVAPLDGRAAARVVERDILDEGLVRIFEEERFDVVVHLAARAGVRPSVEDPLLYQRVNVEGTYRLLELARRFGVPRFVFASSSSVYGARSKVPFRESDPVSRPASPYAATKLAGEAACYTYAHLFGLRVVCLRFFTAYGPRQRPDLAIRKFAERMLRGEPIPVFGDGRTSRDYTHVSDIVEGILGALRFDASPYEIFNLGNENPVTLAELIGLLGEALGVDPVIDRQPEQPGDVPLTCADASKAREQLGFQPRTDLAAGLSDFARWLRIERSARDGANR